MYDFKTLQASIGDATDHFKEELSGIRTGRAAPALLDMIKIESYGSLLPLNQASTVTSEDARTLRVTPWEATAINQIQQAITTANLGVSVSSDGKSVRVSFPELTSERREQLIKLTNTKLEEARIAIRRHREDTWNDIQKKQKAAELTEDDKFRAKENMEKIVKEANDALDELASRKIKELNS